MVMDQEEDSAFFDSFEEKLNQLLLRHTQNQ